MPLPSTMPTRPARRGGWRRVLVPSLAAAVLAVLAGTSIWIGDDAQVPSGGTAAEESKAVAESQGEPSVVSGAENGVGATATDAAAGGAPAAAPAAGAPGSNEISAGDEVAADDLAARGDTGVSVAPPTEDSNGQVDGRTVPIAPDPAAGQAAEPPVGYDQFYAGAVCIVAFDEARLVLPDGRIPQVVEGPGPFGMYLVCG
jgi:hypothetical protein